MNTAAEKMTFSQTKLTRVSLESDLSVPGRPALFMNKLHISRSKFNLHTGATCSRAVLRLEEAPRPR
jgi:hypothetical protein